MSINTWHKCSFSAWSIFLVKILLFIYKSYKKISKISYFVVFDLKSIRRAPDKVLKIAGSLNLKI